MSSIKFGTDGWRAVMCEDFITSNIEIVVQGICNYLHETGKAKNGLVIGYDTRFFSNRFAADALRVCAGNGIKVYISDKDCPTPVTAYSILSKRAAGALMITASHNPPEYNGIKFIPEDAAPALPDVTDKIEAHVKKVSETFEIKKLDDDKINETGLVEVFDPSKPYLTALGKIIDLNSIKNGNLKVIYDPLYSTGRNYVPQILGKATDFTMIHENPDPYFGGEMPDPNSRILGNLAEEVIKTKASIGLANDGDSDRFGIIDSNGSFITPNQVLVLVYLHLLKNRGLKGSAARTVATTHLLDRIAEKYGCSVTETPVGFKYIGNELKKEGIILGGEESGGLSIEGHIPEKDGILAVALMAEIMAVEKKSFTELLEEIYAKFGYYYSRRIDQACSNERKSIIFKKMKEETPDSIAGLKIEKTSELDGFKFYLEDGSWILMRASGTEPLIRIYMESRSEDRLESLAAEVEKLFSEEPLQVG